MLRVLLILWFILTGPTATPTPTPVEAIRYGQTVSGNLSRDHAEVFYRFEGHAGDVLLLTMDRTGGTFDPILILLDTSLQNVLAVDNDSGGDRNARLRFVVPADTSYLIKVTATQSSDSVGGYRLSILLTNPTATPSPHRDAPRLAALRPGEMKSDLDEGVPFRVYAVNLRKGDTLGAVMLTTGTLQAGLYLYTLGFVELGRAELGAAFTITAPADTVYLLIVARISGAGGYTLQATLPDRGSFTVEGTRLIPGQALPGKFGEHIGTFYSFTVLPGTTVDLTLQGAGFLILADAGLNEIAVNAGGAMRGVKLENGGRYSVLLLPSGGPNQLQPGEFSLTLQGSIDVNAPTPTPAPAIVSVAYGISVGGEINSDQQRLFYAFRGAAGDQVVVQMTHVSGNALDPILYLYNYNGGTPVLIGSSDNRTPSDPDALIEKLSLPASGQYLIVATSANKTTGSFTLSLNRSG